MDTNCLRVPFGLGWRAFLIVSAFCAGLGMFFWKLAGSHGWPAYALLSSFVLLASVFGETEIDVAHRVAVQRWRLWNLLPLWWKRQSLSEFSFINVICREDPEQNRLWLVRLSTPTGQHLTVRWFGYASELPAEAFHLQIRLAELTGLPIRNELR